MYRVVATVNTTGDTAGEATGSDTVAVQRGGRLYAVYLDYNASAATTSDVTIAQAEVPSQTLLTITDNATDGWYLPRTQVCGTTGTGLTYDGTRTVNVPFPTTGALTVSVAQGDSLSNCLTAYLYIEED